MTRESGSPAVRQPSGRVWTHQPQNAVRHRPNQRDLERETQQPKQEPDEGTQQSEDDLDSEKAGEGDDANGKKSTQHGEVRDEENALPLQYDTVSEGFRH